AQERYMRAKDAKQSTKPHSVQLTQARAAREKLEKEEAAIYGEVKRHQKAMQEAQEKLAKKREQLEVAKAKESELKVQDASIKGKGFLTAMQKQYEGAVEGRGISKEEHEHVFAALARVLDNVREEPNEDKDGMDTEEAQPEEGRLDVSRDLNYRQKNKSGYMQVGCPRRRQNKFESLTLWTFNGSGWGTIKEKIESSEGGKLQCYAVQEHRLTGDKIAVVSQSMKAKGYQFWCIGMTYTFGKEKRDLSPRNSPGRAAAAWLSVGKGIIYASVCLWTAEGMSFRNTEIINKVESVKMVKGRFVASGASCGTCRHAYGVSEIDYIIVADTLVNQVMYARVREEWPSAPRKPAGLTLRLKAQERMVRVLEKPKKLPELGIGCAPAPPQYQEIASFRSQEVANQERRQCMQTLEQEAFAARGLEWAPDHPAAGRAEEPTWRVKPLSFGGANVPSAAREAVWWRWLARTLHNLQGAYARLKQARTGDIQRHRQVRAAGRWAKLQQWMQESQGKLKEHDQKLLKERRARWADKLQEAAAGAAGGLHKLSKAAQVWRPRRAGSMEDSADPIEAAGYTLKEWNVVWRVGEQIQKVERPWEREERDKLEPFTDQDVDKLKEVARTFRKKTGVGVDRWHPSTLQGASDEAYVRLLDFYMEVERTLRWPIHMGTVFFFMTPKTYTADRVIGLLPTAIRVWEIMREPYMVEWAKKNYRSWDCTSYGKAAEDAAWEVLLSHEMDDVEEQSEETQATVTAVLDLVKAFEKVSLHLLWEAGKQLNFNTGVLAVVCSYFAMTRRLIVGDSVSSETETVTAIIAGSQFSVCFLKTVIQCTVGGLVVERPRARWRMYVGDLRVRLRQQHRHIVTEFGETMDSCFRGFERSGLKLSVGSKDTCAVMAGTKWARRAVTGPMLERGLPVVRACPYLGADIVTHGTAVKTKSGKRHATMKEGVELNMQEVCHMDIAAMLRKDVQATLWEEWTQAAEFKSLSPMPLLAPAIAQLRARGFPKHAKNAAKKVFVGGAWTMEKLCRCNIVPTDICLACGEAVGTEHRRYYKCDALRSQRLQALAGWQHVAEQQDTNMLWTRGLVQVARGDIVCDGSKLGYSDWAQTGWAAMSLNDNGTAKMQMWGPLPCSLPIHRRVKRAEMWAFLKVLERMLPPGRVYTDHKGIVEGLQRGERLCTSWKRPHADLWRRIWHKVKDMDLDIHCVKHVKAHRSKSRIEQLEGEDLKIAKGSSEVDLLAKAGAEMDAHYGKHHALEDLAGRVRWALQNIGWWYQKMGGTWPDVPPKEKGVPRRKVPKPMLTLTEHDVVETGGWQVCI
ncbi:unnamed protein product, partial [Prorocentrum cordatum]